MSPTTTTAIFSGRYQVFQKSVNRSRGALAMTSSRPIGMRLGSSVEPNMNSNIAICVRKPTLSRARFSLRMTPRSLSISSASSNRPPA
jgi:hypothetical protein